HPVRGAGPAAWARLPPPFGLALTPGLSPDHGAPGGGNPPRAQAEPAVNDWLSNVLPPADLVAALVTWTDPVNGQSRSRVVTQDDLDLAPLDLLWTVRPAGQAAMTDLEDRIVGVGIARDQPRPDAVLTIRFPSRAPGKASLLGLSPLVNAVRTLLTTARPLRVSDQVPAAGATPVDRGADDAVSVRRERPAAVRASLASLATTVASL